MLVATLTWQQNEYRKLKEEKEKKEKAQEVRQQSEAAEFVELRERRERLVVDKYKPMEQVEPLESMICLTVTL